MDYGQKESRKTMAGQCNSLDGFIYLYIFRSVPDTVLGNYRRQIFRVQSDPNDHKLAVISRLYYTILKAMKNNELGPFETFRNLSPLRIRMDYGINHR